MARTDKSMFINSNGIVIANVVLYDSTTAFNCVAGYVKPLKIKVGTVTYYAPISTAGTANDRLRFNNCFIRNCVGNIPAKGYLCNTDKKVCKASEGYHCNGDWDYCSTTFSSIMGTYFSCQGNWDYYWECCVGTHMYPPKIIMNSWCYDSCGCHDNIKVTYTLNSDRKTYTYSKSYNSSSSTYYCVTPPTIYY